MSQDKNKPEIHVFNTVDVVALYLGKFFYHGQEPKIKEIVEFLIGNGDSFTYDDTPRLLLVQQKLAKKFQWLASVRYNRDKMKSINDNLIRNHGLTLEVAK